MPIATSSHVYLHFSVFTHVSGEGARWQPQAGADAPPDAV
jgi:hypothetical protein